MWRSIDVNNERQRLDQLKLIVMGCLTKLYDNDAFLFQLNGGKGVSERSLVFRFAHYLQSEVSAKNEYGELFVDCDFNSSYELTSDSRGNIRGRERNGKSIQNPDGSSTRRFIDIIIHKRDYHRDNDFICFEIKKWNNATIKETKKDINNLIRMTTDYGYLFGCHLILGKSRERTKWTIFRNGAAIIDNQMVFDNLAK
jgi:hypothetical protein